MKANQDSRFTPKFPVALNTFDDDPEMPITSEVFVFNTPP